MTNRDCVVWAYRLLLNREPENEAVFEVYESYSIDQLRAAFVSSGEHHSLLDRAGIVLDVPQATDWRTGAIWAYRLLLARDPSEEELTAATVQPVSVSRLRLRIVFKREFEFRFREMRLLGEFAVVNAFAPFPDRVPVADSFQDFIGSVTRVRYLDHAWHGLAGRIQESVPRDSEPSLHGTAEWVGTLRSVLEAGASFSAVELGAGWAPWLIASYRAAIAKGIADIDLTAVEGSADHHAFMLDHFRNNGLDPERYALHYAVVGAVDGTASFPKLHVATDDYGANAAFDDTERAAAAARGELETVESLSLKTLLRDKTRVDLIHIDIQGHEEAVVSAGIDTLNAKARRLVIGTHSRAIESAMMALLESHGWICESESSCRLRPTEAGPWELYVDGEQVWRNPRVPVMAEEFAGLAA